MVQLLTPEGQRVEHPDYPLDITDDEIAALYRDLVLVRRIDTEAIALQRQGELGLWASLLGQEAAQIGAGRALEPQDMAFPTYREHGVAWCRDVDPLTLLGLFRGTNLGGWDPDEQQLQPVHDRHRRADAARDRLRHGRRPRRRGRHRRPRPRHRRARLLRRRRVQPGRRERGVRLGRRRQPAGRLLLPEQPVGDQRAGRAAEPGAAVPALVRLRLPRRAGRRQRRARLPRRHPQGARRRPQRAGPDADRGLHLPDEPAHHQRRPAPLPARQRGRDVEAARTRSSGCGPTSPARPASTPTSSTTSSAEAQAAGRARPRRLPRAARPDARVAVRPRPRRPCPTSCASSATSSSTSSSRGRGA